jgi:hypothetical protein
MEFSANLQDGTFPRALDTENADVSTNWTENARKGRF